MLSACHFGVCFGFVCEMQTAFVKMDEMISVLSRQRVQTQQTIMRFECELAEFEKRGKLESNSKGRQSYAKQVARSRSMLAGLYETSALLLVRRLRLERLKSSFVASECIQVATKAMVATAQQSLCTQDLQRLMAQMASQMMQVDTKESMVEDLLPETDEDDVTVTTVRPKTPTTVSSLTPTMVRHRSPTQIQKPHVIM
jgi:hypothetical protein